jgi:lipopolysaccharide export LptBFGC system permease protein LptF
MNVTREVVTDLLPIYFSGEASGDTKVLVEDYFRHDPDFESIARRAATPIETLRAAAPIAAGSEKEKRDLESVLWRLQRRKWLFGVSLFLTLVPLSFDFNHGHAVSLMVRDAPWHAAFDWSLAAALWFLYFARMRWRMASLVCAIFFTLIPIPFVLHSGFVGGPIVEFAIIWIVAAFVWLGYFRQHPR